MYAAELAQAQVEILELHERPLEVFSNLGVEESEENDPFIDLLSPVPRALGKVPVVENEDEGKRAKKKPHHERDLERAKTQQTVEAMHISRHEKEVRLEDLRPIHLRRHLMYCQPG